ncbi:hypothetical protein Poli38472_011955 [Pythium oligandrum]|uniref:Protein kinase domain-containing protein n=1 Tax=Pythium oligandrum TaxID=41045 RepID=A0A8K1FN10_PYTOL|nr:hypothetical protein Poli38472_011955 [Pythium oligandrum]|eukprot:TMW66839.1 hypothetical protein Poli38472_011955 [Pythium oligandrum]
MSASRAAGSQCPESVQKAMFDFKPQQTCALDSGGYSFYVITTPPSKAQLRKICDSDECEQTVAKLAETEQMDCVTTGGFHLYEDIITPIVTECEFENVAIPQGGSTVSSDGEENESTPASAIIPGDLNSEAIVNATKAIVDKIASGPTSDPPPGSASNAAVAKPEEGGGPVGPIAISVAVVAILAIGWFVYKRRKSQRSSNQKGHDNGDEEEAQADGAYNGIGKTPVSRNVKSNMTAVTTISTGAGTSSRHYGAGGSTGDSLSGDIAGGLWNDPIITAIRVPMEKVVMRDLISRGGFGEVYRGMYKEKEVAIKRLLPERRKDVVQINSFLAEVKLMAAMDHERIVQFVGVAWDSLSDLCVLSEYMSGGDLRTALARLDKDGEPTGFTVDKIRIGLHVAHALTYLHSLQPVVVHRDLKSKNILLSESFDAKLTDFGVSRERADSTMTAGVGSSLWMAPEVMMGQRYDEKADIFSFGVVLSELDSHRLPYSHAKEPGTGRKIPETAVLQMVALGRLKIEFSDAADPEIAELALACVSLEPENRPTAPEVLYRLNQLVRSHGGFV